MDPVLVVRADIVLVDSLHAVRVHRSELRESMTALEQALSGPAPGRESAWAERVHVALVELTSDLRTHVQVTEGPDGLHHEVLGTAPRLAGRVTRLTAEHGEIALAVDALLVVVTPPLSADVVTEARELGVRLLGRLVRHRQAGADLVYEAYQSDIGGQD